MASLSFSVFKDLDFVSVHKNAKRKLYPIILTKLAWLKIYLYVKVIGKSGWHLHQTISVSVIACGLQSQLELKGFSLGNLVFPLSLKTNSRIDLLPEADMYQVIDRYIRN